MSKNSRLVHCFLHGYITTPTMIKNTALIVIFTLINLSCKNETKKEIRPTTPQKPNIILIVADDQGWGDLSIHGNHNLSTPNIDAIAENGVSFENFYVQPVCSPTRAELLTGRHFSRIGVYSTSTGGERFNLKETTIANILKDAGYHTAAYGKWHNGMQPPYHPNARGFDDFYGFASGHWGNYFSPMLEHNGKIVTGKGFLTDDLTQHGLDFITEHQKEPFFLYLPYNIPHSPMQVPDTFWNRFKDKQLQQTYHGKEEEHSNFTKAALAMVENIDYNVGRITEQLNTLGIEENTIVIYLSDNGPNGWRWNGGMRGRKGAVDEGGVRSPFFVQWKKTLPAGKKITEIASSIDVLPTLASLTNTPTSTTKPLDGRSLTPLLFDKNETWDERLVYNHWLNKTSVRSQKYRLDKEDRLYDIENDRGQTTDISAQYPQLTDSLKRAKNAWLADVKPLSAKTDHRSFPLGHPDYEYTQIPARDGIAHGGIKRSSIHPNNSFFYNWKSEKDSITWDIDVLADGTFEVELYYTLTEADKGVAVTLSHGESLLSATINETHNPPLKGMENDRVERDESYVKDFKAVRLGEMNLKKGQGIMTLKAPKIRGKSAMDVRLLMFRRL